jgi:hypothetical protein
MSLRGSRGWSKAGRSESRAAYAIICDTAGASFSRISASSWSRTSPTRSEPFGSASARKHPIRRARAPRKTLSYQNCLRFRRHSLTCPPTTRLPLSWRFGTASRMAVLPNSNLTSNSIPRGPSPRSPEPGLTQQRCHLGPDLRLKRLRKSLPALSSLLSGTIKDSNRREELQACLEQHPNGHFAGLARARLSSPEAP